MVLDPIPQSLPVHFLGSRPQPPTSRLMQFIPHEYTISDVIHSMWIYVLRITHIRVSMHTLYLQPHHMIQCERIYMFRYLQDTAGVPPVHCV